MHPVALTSVLFLHFMLSDCICSCEGTGKEFLPSRFQMARRHVNVRTKKWENADIWSNIGFMNARHAVGAKILPHLS